MGRATRNSNAANRPPPPVTGTNHENAAGPRIFIAVNAKGQETESSLVGNPGGNQDKGTDAQQTTIFDFPNQVPFEYTPRQSGFGSVLEFMKNGNENVKEKILNECNLIFECRCCNNLFRSPRDFFTHKDKHCTEKYEKVSPAGLTELLRLAQNSFNVNQDVQSSNAALVTVRPQVSSERHVGHAVPILTTAVRSSSSGEQRPEGQKGLESKELELLTDTVGQRTSGVLQTARQLPRESNGEVKLTGGKYKSSESENVAALLGADGKTAVEGKPSDMQTVLDLLTAQWESKLEEEVSQQSNLKCSICHMLCWSVKGLRIHMRQDHAYTQKSTGQKRKKTGEGINRITKEMKGTLLDQNQKSVMGGPLSVKAKALLSKARKRPGNQLAIPPPSPHSKETAAESATSPSEVYAKVLPKEPKASPSRVSSFRRLTNNSFSSTLALSPGSTTIIPIHELKPPLKKPKQGSTKSNSNRDGQVPVVGSMGISLILRPEEEEEKVDYRAMAKALFPTDKKKGRRSTKVKNRPILPKPAPALSAKKIACLKCMTGFGTEQEMSLHLSQFHGSGQNTASKISILDRQDYIKPLARLASSSSSGGGGEEGGSTRGIEKSKPSTPLPFNNNENEVGEGGVPADSLLCFEIIEESPERVRRPSSSSTARIRMPELIPADRA